MTNPTTPRPKAVKLSDTELAVRNFLEMHTGGTLYQYTNHLTKLFTWCDDVEVEPLEATRRDLESFHRHLREQDLATGTIAARLSVVKNFYRIAYADQYVDHDPSVMLRKVKVRRDEARATAYTRRDMNLMLGVARTRPTVDGALIGLLTFLGMRVSEACSIQIEDFAHGHEGHRVIRYIGKGDKPAEHPVAPQLYVLLAAAAGERATGPLLLRKDGHQMDRLCARRRVQSIAKKAGVGSEHHGPHSIRRGVITALLADGHDRRLVADLSNHASIRTLDIYDIRVNKLNSSLAYAHGQSLSAAA